MKTKLISLLGLFLFGIFFSANAQEITGKWKTIDDETNKAKSVVEIYKGDDGLFYGKVIKLFIEPGEEPNPVCDQCTGANKDKPVMGFVVITKMKADGKNLWNGGKITDPGNGKVYSCKMWREPGVLQVRGYLGISALGRSQTWYPYKGN